MSKVIEYLHNLFMAQKNEQLYMLLFNNEMSLAKTVLLKEGVVNNVSFDHRSMADHITKNHASVVILAHNHPNGRAKPSEEDIEATETIREFLNMLGVDLLEHVIIAGDKHKLILRSLEEEGNGRSSSFPFDDKKFFRCSVTLPDNFFDCPDSEDEDAENENMKDESAKDANAENENVKEKSAEDANAENENVKEESAKDANAENENVKEEKAEGESAEDESMKDGNTDDKDTDEKKDKE